MNDPEFKEMVNKAIFIVSVVLVFTIPVFFIFKNKIMITENKMSKDIRNGKTVLLYVTENRCNICKIIKKELDDKNIEYEEINKDKENDYDIIIEQIGLRSSNTTPPALIYIEKGKLISYVVNIESKEDLDTYLKKYK